MIGTVFDDVITIPARTGMGELANASEYSYRASALYKQSDLETAISFFAKLQSQQELRLALESGDRQEWEPGNIWHHLAFGRHYPNAQDVENPQPIISRGGVLKVGEFNRVLATYWEPYSGRKLYLNFESASMGPHVKLLMVHEIPSS